METDYWATHYRDNKVQDEIEDEDFDLEAELRRIEELADATEEWVDDEE